MQVDGESERKDQRIKKEKIGWVDTKNKTEQNES